MFEIVKLRHLQAGNIHARRPVIVLSLSDETPLEVSNAVISELAGALPPVLPAALNFPLWHDLVTADGPVPTVSVMEALAILIQRFVNWPVSYCGSHRPFGKVSPRDAREAVFEAGALRPAQSAGQLAVVLANQLISAEGGNPERLREVLAEHLVSYHRATNRETPNADALAVAAQATARGISWTSVPKTRFVRLGQSRNARLLIGSETTALSAVDKQLISKKTVAWKALRRAGIPFVKQRIAQSHEDIERFAHAIGYPVTVTPADVAENAALGDDGIELQGSSKERSTPGKFLVENLIPGDRYRFLVIDEKFVAACRRRPAQVIGDGQQTVHELVEQENRRPERRAILKSRAAIFASLKLEAEALALLDEQGLHPDSIPEIGRVVTLGHSTRIEDGGDTVDVTDEVHPELCRLAERVAHALGIVVCGVDLITTDVSRPIEETHGAICGVNTRPGLGLHLLVSEGQSRPVDRTLLDMLLPKGAPNRIPVVAMLPGAGTRSLFQVVERAAKRAGITLGVYQAQRVGDRSPKHIVQLESGAAVDLNHRLDAAFLEVDPRELVRTGLGLERIDLAVVPEGNANRPIADAASILSRAANNRAVSSESSQLAHQVLTALGLPTRGLGIRQKVASPPEAPCQAAPGPKFCATFVGDIGFGESYMHQPSSGSLQLLLDQNGYRYSLSGLQTFVDGADYLVGNLEVPLAERPDIGLRGRKRFLGWSNPVRTVDALVEAKFSALSLANNHALDCGVSGLLASVGRLLQHGIGVLGAGNDRTDAEAPLIRPFMVGERKCNLVVFAGYLWRARYDRYRWYAGRKSVGVATLDPIRIGGRIEELRAKLENPIFIAYPHWGADYAQEVSDEQRHMAQALLSAGIDLVIGHGSHTIQPMEMIAGRPVLFGLGNFVWNSAGRYDKHGVLPYSLIASLVFEADGQDVATRLRLHPIVTDNRLTEFRNHGVNRDQLEEIASLLKQHFQGELRRGRDDAGYYIDAPIHTLFQQRTSTESTTDEHDARTLVALS